MVFLQKSSYWFFNCVATSFHSLVCGSNPDDLIPCSPSCIHKCFPLIVDSQKCHRHSQNLLFLLLQKQLLLPNRGPTPNRVDKMVSDVQGGGVLVGPSRLWMLLWETPRLSNHLSLNRDSWDYECCGGNFLAGRWADPLSVKWAPAWFSSRSDCLLKGWHSYPFWIDREMVVTA